MTQEGYITAAGTPGRWPRWAAVGLAVALCLAPLSLAAQRGRRGGPALRGAAPAFRVARPPAPAPEVRPQETPRETSPAAEAGQRPPLGVGLERLAALPPEQREQRLRSDPNFQRLPPERQQQMLRSLDKLNAMTPQQQQRLITRMRDLGRLNAEQRAGLENIFHQFQAMPPEQRRAFRTAYNNLRMLPPEQRERRMSRPEFQSRFSPEQLQSLHQALALNLPADVVGVKPE